MASILGSVVCTPTIARAGDSILVEVYPPRGLAYNNTEMVPIAINGVCGSSQYLVWTTPGTHRVVVTAHPPEGMSSRSLRPYKSRRRRPGLRRHSFASVCCPISPIGRG